MRDSQANPESFGPHGATAVTAAVTALIAGLLSGIAGILWLLYVVVGIEDQARESPTEISRFSDLIAMGIVAPVIGLAWLVGGFLLLMYMKTGRVLLILASGVALVASVVQLVNRGFAVLYIPLAVSLLILSLCVVPATGRWIGSERLEPNPGVEHDV
ncbi:hypothetical protein IRT45_28450 [Nocardia sp. BSTN01]|uniref:hypothetical protein n=1 Tax=Nocardia sp. BSTN01 TaxID=2783665 RepID=UPI00188F4313|nr:hypothetical protein [Nocardia sp. BSTN01]MBF5001073.1 hypothetical protein [Nocardia sp. BSTN01]